MPRKKRPAHEVLGVEKTAKPEKVKQQYRALARLYHPDRNPGNQEAEEKFKEAQAAYDEMTGKSNTTVDPEQGAILQILSEALNAITVQVLEQGGSVTENNIVNLMKTGLVHARSEHEKNLKKANKIIKELGKLKGRFTTIQGAEDVLSLLVESRIATTEQNARVSQIMMDRLDKAIEILGFYGYKVDVEQVQTYLAGRQKAMVYGSWGTSH